MRNPVRDNDCYIGKLRSKDGGVITQIEVSVDLEETTNNFSRYARVFHMQANGELAFAHESMTTSLIGKGLLHKQRFHSGKFLSYSIDQRLGTRMLISNFGTPVIVKLSSVDEIIDGGNCFALMEICRRLLYLPKKKQLEEMNLLIPEANRVIKAKFLVDKSKVISSELGMVFEVASDKTECLYVGESAFILDKLSHDQISSFHQQLMQEEVLGSQVGQSGVYHPVEFFDANQAQATPIPGLVPVKETIVRSRTKEKLGKLVLIGGSGEYSPNGLTRLGESIGYSDWIEDFSKLGFDVLSLARVPVACPDYPSFKTEVIRLIAGFFGSACPSEKLVLLGHSLGGMIASDVYAEVCQYSPSLVLLSTPARGMQAIILRQLLGESLKAMGDRISIENRIKYQKEQIRQFFDSEVQSVSAQLRASDKRMIKAFLLFKAHDAMARWPKNTKLKVFHGLGDTQVSSSEAKRWLTAASLLGISANTNCFHEADHLFRPSNKTASSFDLPKVVLRSIFD